MKYCVHYVVIHEIHVVNFLFLKTQIRSKHRS